MEELKLAVDIAQCVALFGIVGVMVARDMREESRRKVKELADALRNEPINRGQPEAAAAMQRARAKMMSSNTTNTGGSIASSKIAPPPVHPWPKDFS